MKRGLQKFIHDTQGAIAVLVLLLFPLLALIGGLATDVTMLNAQKRYVQSQADLAAQSAARYLPDVAKVRTTARQVVLRNPRYGLTTLTDADIQLGSYDRATGLFTPNPNQVNPTGSTAVRVLVSSEFDPVLLKPLLADENLTIRRKAVGTQSDIIVFSLRNSILSVDTSASVLDPLLRNILGVELSAAVVGYRGLANAEVSLNNLLGLGRNALDLGTSAGVLTFNDVLNAPIQLTSVLGMDPLGLLLTRRGTPSAPASLGLGSLLLLSPGLANAKIGDVLPDINVSAFDLVTAMLGLAGARVPDAHRVNVGQGLNLGPLANTSLTVGVLSQPVIVAARMSDRPLPSATIEQANVALTADVLDLSVAALPKLIGLNLSLGAIRAEAVPVSLNCAATGGQTLASFTVTPSLASLSVQMGVLKTTAETNDVISRNPALWLLRGLVQISIDSDASTPQTLLGTPQTVTITANQFTNRQAVVVSTNGLLVPLSASLSSVISSLKVRLVVLGGVTGLDSLLSTFLTMATNLVLTPLKATLAPMADGIATGVLRILGVRVLPAELVLHDVSCGGKLVQ